MIAKVVSLNRPVVGDLSPCCDVSVNSMTTGSVMKLPKMV